MLYKEELISGRKIKNFSFANLHSYAFFPYQLSNDLNQKNCVCHNPHCRQLHASTRLETLGFLSRGNLCCSLAKPLPSSTLLCPRGLANEKPGWRLHAEGGTRAYYPHYPPPSTLSTDFQETRCFLKWEVPDPHTTYPSAPNSFLPGHSSDNSLTVVLHTLLHYHLQSIYIAL